MYRYVGGTRSQLKQVPAKGRKMFKQEKKQSCLMYEVLLSERSIFFILYGGEKYKGGTICGVLCRKHHFLQTVIPQNKIFLSCTVVGREKLNNRQNR